ncbi:hypothetical protein ACQ4PT_057283 [Festuca glaucescens]
MLPIEPKVVRDPASDHVPGSIDQAPFTDSNPDLVSGLGHDDSGGPAISADGLQEFEKMIDEMVYKVWECGQCLRMGHNSKDCTNDIRCRAYFSYGHVAKQCLNKQSKKSHAWVRKRVSTDIGLLDSRFSPVLSSTGVSLPSTLKQSTQPPLPPPPCSPQTPSPAEVTTPMAVFELDPTPWLPLGHEIIDDSPTRLPRTYYTPTVPPPRRHDNYCIAYIEPPQPEGNGFWRDQVRDFVQGNLGLDVMDCQHSLFGVGLYEMRSAAAHQILVQHPLRQIDEGVFVRFVNHDESVASFGKYIDWHRDDPLKERTLVQGWTIVCYVLTTDFVDAMPTDEDPMSVDGNPHPFPGNLLPMMNNFVLPPFPKLGWNEWPIQAPGAPGAAQQGNDQMHEAVFEPVVEEIVRYDIVLDESIDTASSSAQIVNIDHDSGAVEMLQPAVPVQVLNVWHFQYADTSVRDIRPLLFSSRSMLCDKLAVPNIVGPALPPDMIWAKVFQSWLPKALAENVPLPIGSSPFRDVILTKRSWVDAFDEYMKGVATGSRRFRFCHLFLLPTPITPAQKKKRGKAKKLEAPLVDTSVRRCTRSMVKNNGYRPAPISDTVVKPRAKRAKTQIKKCKRSKEKVPASQNEDEVTQPPQTPIHVLQSIGISLGIDPAKLTEEKLTAAPEISKDAHVSDK